MAKLMSMNTAFLLKLLEARGISPAELAREINESQQTVHNWKARGRYPASKVPKIAKFLHVTGDELMAGKLADEKSELGTLNDEEESLVLAWRGLPVEIKQQIHLALQQYQAALLNFPALANGTFSAGLRANRHFEKAQAYARVPGSARAKKTK